MSPYMILSSDLRANDSVLKSSERPCFCLCFHLIVHIHKLVFTSMSMPLFLLLSVSMFAVLFEWLHLSSYLRMCFLILC